MNYYEILEVSEKSSTEVITGAYKALTKKYHPDVSNDARANEKMKSINRAYEVLSDPKKRAEYDRVLHLNQKTNATNSSDRNVNNEYYENADNTAQRQEERRRREYAKKQAEEQARKEAQERYYKQEAERKAAGLREKEKRKKAKRKRLVLGIIAALVVFLYYTNHLGSDGGSGKSLGIVSPSGKEAASYVEKAKTLINIRDYHGAMKAIDACRTHYPNSKAAAECDLLVLQIEEAVKNYEPKNGTTLERTFQYMGSSVLRVTAKSGPVTVTISEKKDPSAHVTMYVRKGQTAELTVTGGTYRVDYNIGYLWFNDKIGFGDFCERGSFQDDFVFKIETVGTWISSDVWEITI